MVSKFILGDLFWVSGLGLLASIFLIGYIYKMSSIGKGKLMFYGLLLIASASMVMLGFNYTLKEAAEWIPHITDNDERSLAIKIETSLSIIQYVIPLSVAAIGSFCITKSMDASLTVT